MGVNQMQMEQASKLMNQFASQQMNNNQNNQSQKGQAE